nr:hypothetical protein GCM10020092_103460 [Actinoplanes digitatis]
MLAYATQLTRDRAAAEDVVQEALVRAWRHPDSLVNGKGSVRGWLLTVVRNIVTDQVRARRARATEVRESPIEAAVEGDHAEQVVNSMVVVDALSSALRRAPRGPRAGLPARQHGRGSGQDTGHPARDGQVALLLRPTGITRAPVAECSRNGTVSLMKTNHEDLAGYLTKSLDAEQLRQFEEHLVGCAECRAEAESLQEWTMALEAVPEAMLLDGPPEGGDLLLQRTLRQIRDESAGRRHRQSALVGAAAAVVVAAAIASGVVVGRSTAEPANPIAQPPATVEPTTIPGTKTATALDPDTGARITVAVAPAPGWVRIKAAVVGIPAERAVPARGRRRGRQVGPG